MTEELHAWARTATRIAAISAMFSLFAAIIAFIIFVKDWGLAGWHREEAKLILRIYALSAGGLTFVGVAAGLVFAIAAGPGRKTRAAPRTCED